MLPATPLPEDLRRAAFAALIAAQDGGVSVAASRTRVARAFGLTDDQVREVEREGIDGQWPPLAEPTE